MKKTMKMIGICCIAAIIFAGIYLSIPSKTLDFRGTVTDIQTTGHEIIFQISAPSIGTSYVVIADHQTNVSPCHKDDPKIDLADIKVGDSIEGDYRRSSNDCRAKFITVWYHQ